MPYRAELEYLKKVLGKLRLQTMHLRVGRQPEQSWDLGLRKLLGLDEDWNAIFRAAGLEVQEGAIYKITDVFRCNYILLALPGGQELLLAGPYLNCERTQEQMMEEAEGYGIPAQLFRQLQLRFAELPVLRDEGWLFHMFYVLGETLWGRGDTFPVVEVRQEDFQGEYTPPEETRDPEEIMLHIKSMETRYEYENRLIELVSQGMTHRAEMMIAQFSALALEQRSADPVRNVKNYAIVCNTLLRKAAESAGVHPVHLDSVSSELAHRVESIASGEDGIPVMREMVRAYCRLVRQHSDRHYSPPVQKTVAYIESDLTGDLSLRALSAMQNVSASYFSTLFRKETGKTVTEYVTDVRMDNAARLLHATHLQVQTVAQHCGMSDVNYFSKVFKRHFGVSPKQFREEHHPHLPKKV